MFSTAFFQMLIQFVAATWGAGAFPLFKSRIHPRCDEDRQTGGLCDSFTILSLVSVSKAPYPNSEGTEPLRSYCVQERRHIRHHPLPKFHSYDDRRLSRGCKRTQKYIHCGWHCSVSTRSCASLCWRQRTHGAFAFYSLPSTEQVTISNGSSRSVSITTAIGR